MDIIYDRQVKIHGEENLDYENCYFEDLEIEENLNAPKRWTFVTEKDGKNLEEDYQVREMIKHYQSEKPIDAPLNTKSRIEMQKKTLQSDLMNENKSFKLIRWDL